MEVSIDNGPLVVQEYLQQLIRLNPCDIYRITERPPEVAVTLWLYEHIRQFIIELNLLVNVLEENCHCHKMNVTEQWQFLCASHSHPQEVKHTLFSATPLII